LRLQARIASPEGYRLEDWRPASHPKWC
jgi:hypothetical protein